jgi:Na+/phosphate symporter
MKSLKFWEILSNISTVLCIVGIIFNLFFKEIIDKHRHLFVLIAPFVIGLFLVSQLMKYILKREKQ